MIIFPGVVSRELRSTAINIEEAIYPKVYKRKMIRNSKQYARAGGQFF